MMNELHYMHSGVSRNQVADRQLQLGIQPSLVNELEIYIHSGVSSEYVGDTHPGVSHKSVMDIDPDASSSGVTYRHLGVSIE